MAYTTLVAGGAITASWANTNVRDQSVTPFADSATRDAAITSPVEGMWSYLQDVDSFCGYTGSAWATVGPLTGYTSYTPTMTASSVSPTLGTGSTRTGFYFRAGRFINFYLKIAWGSSGTTAGSGTYRMSLPVNGDSDWVGAPIGFGYINNSGTTYYGWDAIMEAAGYVILINGDSTGTNDTWSSTWDFSPGASDFVIVTGSYEAAS